jgi:hypothetical protein
MKVTGRRKKRREQQAAQAEELTVTRGKSLSHFRE